MKVKELIAKLQEEDQKAEVILHHLRIDHCFYIHDVKKAKQHPVTYDLHPHVVLES